MAAPVWLIEIRASSVWRFATRRVKFDGSVWHDGLEDPGSFDLGIDFDEPQERNFSFVLNAQQARTVDTEDVAIGATATAYYWQDPDGADPVVLVSGTIEDPEYGGADEPLSATIREVPWDDRGSVLPDTAMFSYDTWPYDFAGGLGGSLYNGEWYPIIIGKPGETFDAAAGQPLVRAFGSPAPIADRWHYLNVIAGHHVLATQVHCFTPGYSNWSDLAAGAGTVINGYDSLGRAVAYVDTTANSDWTNVLLYAAAHDIDTDNSDDVWISWSGDIDAFDAGTGGGLENPEKPGTLLRGAGDLIEWLLRRSTLRVDFGRLRAAKIALNAFVIDCYIQPTPGERLAPWSWITDNLLPLLPVSVRTGPGGLYLAVFDPGTPASEAVAHLTDGLNCERISPVLVGGTGEIVNDWSLSYFPDGASNSTTKTVRITGDQLVKDMYSDARTSAALVESVRRFGTQPSGIETSIIYDSGTANRILTAKAALYALPYREVSYAVDDLWHMRALEPGDVVTITDASLGWDERPAHVWSVSIRTQREVTFRLWHVPGRDSV